MENQSRSRQTHDPSGKPSRGCGVVERWEFSPPEKSPTSISKRGVTDPEWRASVARNISPMLVDTKGQLRAAELVPVRIANGGSTSRTDGCLPDRDESRSCDDANNPPFGAQVPARRLHPPMSCHTWKRAGPAIPLSTCLRSHSDINVWTLDTHVSCFHVLCSARNLWIAE
jgi:hypothetical protein